MQHASCELPLHVPGIGMEMEMGKGMGPCIWELATGNWEVGAENWELAAATSCIENE